MNGLTSDHELKHTEYPVYIDECDCVCHDGAGSHAEPECICIGRG